MKARAVLRRRIAPEYQIPVSVYRFVSLRQKLLTPATQSLTRRKLTMKKRLSVILSLAMLIALALSACGGSSDGGGASDGGDGEKVLKVAVCAPLTGTGARAGTGFIESTKMAFEDIDYKVGDYTIEMITVDLTDDPEKGALALEQAIVRDGAQVATQGWFTTGAMASMDVVARYEIPYLFNYGAGQSIDEKYATDPDYYKYYIGKTYPLTDFIAVEYRDLVVEAMESGAISGDKTICLYGEDTDWARSLGANYRKYFEEAGYTILTEDYFAAGTTDLYAILSKMQAAGPTLVAGTINTPATAAAFTKQAKEINLGLPIIMQCLNESAEWRDLCGDSAEGVIDQWPGWKDQRGQDFCDRWEKRMGYAASITTEGVAYDNALLFIDALQKCYDMYGVLDTESILKFGWEEINGGNYSFDSIIQPAYRWEPGSISPVVGQDAFFNPLGQVQGGEFVTIFPAERAEADPIW